MNPIYDNDIYLNLQIRKSETGENGKTDEYGNYIFEVEASNENIDLQNQIVLQRALLESKEDFLKSGVISNDHLHRRKDEDGNVISDPSQVIGEPVDVRTEGTKTIVVGKLYKSNEKAQDYIRMLKDGSKRVRASVGGIFPKIAKDAKTGIEKITHVFWNDLALTTSPVNNTVGAAAFAKSMDPEEFVKALSAGYKTDGKQTSGTNLIPEDMNTETQDTLSTDSSVEPVDQPVKTAEKIAEKTGDEEDAADIVKSLFVEMEEGNISTGEEVKGYLMNKGFSEETSCEFLHEIINQGEKLMKKTLSEAIDDLKKSLAGKNKTKAEDEAVTSEDVDNEDILNLDFDDNKEEGVDDTGDPSDGKTEKSCKKSLDEDEYVDGSEFLKSMVDEITDLRRENEELRREVQNDRSEITKSLQAIQDALESIGAEKIPARSVMNKSVSAADKVSATKADRLTAAEFDKCQDILIKSVQAGEISIAKSSKISSDMQRNMATGAPMDPEYYAFLSERINGGR